MQIRNKAVDTLNTHTHIDNTRPTRKQIAEQPNEHTMLSALKNRFAVAQYVFTTARNGQHTYTQTLHTHNTCTLCL